MHVLIVGAAGMIGRKLTERLLKDKKLHGQPIKKLTLQDVVAPEEPRDKPFAIETRAGDLSVPGEAGALVADNPDVIFHLAAIVSGEAPGKFAVTWIVGKSTLGRSDTGSSRYAAKPKTRIPIMTRVVMTGRRMNNSATLTTRPPGRPGPAHRPRA